MPNSFVQRFAAKHPSGGTQGKASLADEQAIPMDDSCHCGSPWDSLGQSAYPSKVILIHHARPKLGTPLGLLDGHSQVHKAMQFGTNGKVQALVAHTVVGQPKVGGQNNVCGITKTCCLLRGEVQRLALFHGPEEFVEGPQVALEDQKTFRLALWGSPSKHRGKPPDDQSGGPRWRCRLSVLNGGKAKFL